VADERQEDAEDMVQESYLRHSVFSELPRGTNCSAWFLRDVPDTMLHRVGSRHMKETGATGFEVDEIEDPAPLLQQALLEGDGRSGAEAIAALPVDFREVVVLRNYRAFIQGNL